MRSSYVAANMALPALKSVALSKRLQSFEAHHGALLAEVLHELAREAAGEPRSLIASTTYDNALVLAGKAREARAEAARGFELNRVMMVRGFPCLARR